MSFPPAKAERMLLHWGWPRRTVAIRRRHARRQGQPEWVDEPGSDASGIDLSRATALVKALSHLETLRYVQYERRHPALHGIDSGRD